MQQEESGLSTSQNTYVACRKRTRYNFSDLSAICRKRTQYNYSDTYATSRKRAHYNFSQYECNMQIGDAVSLFRNRVQFVKSGRQHPTQLRMQHAGETASQTHMPHAESGRTTSQNMYAA